MPTSFRLLHPQSIPYWREVYFYTICNILDCSLLNGSHTTILHMVTLYSTPCWSEPSEDSPFQDLENQLYLLLGSMTDPTNQYKTFHRVLSSLTLFEKLPRMSPIP